MKLFNLLRIKSPKPINNKNTNINNKNSYNKLAYNKFPPIEPFTEFEQYNENQQEGSV